MLKIIFKVQDSSQRLDSFIHDYYISIYANLYKCVNRIATMSSKIYLISIITLMVLLAPNKGFKIDKGIKKGFNFWGIFQTIGNVKRILGDQYNDTLVTLNRAYDLLADTFTDTATSPRPMPGNETRSTTEKYRISRYDFGVLLNRNYRGLKKLYRLEKADAHNASLYNIQQYKSDWKNSLANFATFDDDP